MRDFRSTWLVTWVLVLSIWLGLARGMRESQVRELRCVSPLCRYGFYRQLKLSPPQKTKN